MKLRKPRGRVSKRKNDSWMVNFHKKQSMSVEDTNWVNKRLESLAKKAVTMNPEAVNRFLKESWTLADQGMLHPLDIERVQRLTDNFWAAHNDKRISIDRDTLSLIKKVSGKYKKSK